MMRIDRTWRAALPILAGLLTPAPLQPQSIHGRVLELGADRAVAFAEIRLLDSDGSTIASALADSTGNFHVAAPAPGTYFVGGDRFGFDAATSPALTIRAGETRFVELRLPAATFVLDAIGVYVEAESHRLADVGFYERRRTGHGYYIDPGVIRQRQPRNVSDLFINVPGTRLIPASGGRNRILLRGGVRTGCTPQIYVDEVAILRHDSREILLLDDIVAAGDLEGIEVYRSHAELPTRFSSDLGRCGAIVVWTRAGSRR